MTDLRPIDAFADAIAAAGLGRPPEIVADGELHRFQAESDKRGTLNGWFWLRLDGEATFGAFGSWKTGLKRGWHSGGRRLSPAERREAEARSRREREQREQERLARWSEVAERARRIWDESTPATAHPYLTRKRVEPFGTRVRGELLVVPLYTTDRRLWSIQFIGPGGAKRFLKGGRKRGCYYPITSPGALSDKVLIAEGFATAATLHMATRHPVAVAFDAGNLGPVAQALRAKYPDRRLVIAADNDTKTPGNPGLSSAIAAARAVGGTYIVPSFGA